MIFNVNQNSFLENACSQLHPDYIKNTFLFWHTNLELHSEAFVILRSKYHRDRILKLRRSYDQKRSYRFSKDLLCDLFSNRAENFSDEKMRSEYVNSLRGQTMIFVELDESNWIFVLSHDSMSVCKMFHSVLNRFLRCSDLTLLRDIEVTCTTVFFNFQFYYCVYI